MVYSAICFLIMFFSGICKVKIPLKSGPLSTSNHLLSGRVIYLVLFSIIFIILIGCRHYTIGIDTQMYQYCFSNYQQQASVKELLNMDETSEIGFRLLNYFLGKIAEFQFFLLIEALILIIPLAFVVYKYSDMPWLSLFLYVTFGYFTFYMSGQRQAIAMSFTLIAYYFAREKKPIKFLFCMAFACLFHKTAIIFLPAYWLTRIKLSKRTIIFAISLMALSFIAKTQFFNIINQFARMQYEFLEAGGEKMYVFMLLNIALGFIYYKNLRNIDSQFLLYAQIISAIIWPIASINPAVYRLYYYYHILLMLYVPKLFLSIPGKFERYIVLTGYLGVGFYYLATQVLVESMSVNPYLFYWQ